MLKISGQLPVKVLQFFGGRSKSDPSWLASDGLWISSTNYIANIRNAWRLCHGHDTDCKFEAKRPNKSKHEKCWQSLLNLIAQLPPRTGHSSCKACSKPTWSWDNQWPSQAEINGNAGILFAILFGFLFCIHSRHFCCQTFCHWS